MSLDDWHLAFVSVCIILVLAACSPVVAAYLPRREEPFFALAVLGEKGTAEHYYPMDDSNIAVGEIVRWTLYLYNHIGEAQYVALRVKLLNSIMASPNSTSCEPSPAMVVYEARFVLLNNETLLYPFSWSLKEVIDVDEFREIKLLSVNDENVKSSIIAKNGYNFRVIIELWVYDENLNDFKFGWNYGDELRCAWNQIWFNSTSIVG